MAKQIKLVFENKLDAQWVINCFECYANTNVPKDYDAEFDIADLLGDLNLQMFEQTNIKKKKKNKKK